MRYRLLTAIASVLLFAAVCFAQEAKQEAKKDGWWIKAGPQKSQMVFYVGTTSNSYTFWRVWNPGEPVEFDVPDEFKNGPTLYILAQSTSGQKCGFCMMYKDKGVKHIEYELEADHQAKQTDEDQKCK